MTSDAEKRSTMAGRQRFASLVWVMLLAGCLVGGSIGCSASRPGSSASPPPATDPVSAALDKVREERGEEIGGKAIVEVPVELKHYSDRRRFLAVQTAAERQLNLPLPHDFAELAEMILAGKLVEMPELGDDYVLYGVGLNASDEPFTHFNRETKLSVALCLTDEDFAAERTRLEESVNRDATSLLDLEKTLRSIPRRDRAARKTLSREIASTRSQVSLVKAQLTLLGAIDRNPVARGRIIAEQRLLEELARNFAGHSYDLNDAGSRKAMKRRMLSFIRPEARDVLLEIAHSYRAEFGRALPVTSLIRTEQYQKRLRESNRGAARNSSPPHVTGLAFDVLYRYMTAGEQQSLMTLIARLKAEGRVEALRENRNHYHIFAFATGRPPDEELVTAAVKESRVYGAKKPKRPAGVASRKTRARSRG